MNTKKHFSWGAFLDWDLDVILSDEDMTVLLTLEEFIDEID